MQLSKFILSNMELILSEWETHARSLGANTSEMGSATLRDHAELMLRAIAADLERPQSAAQQEAKGTGHAPARPAHLPESPATSHGTLRAEDGFTLEQMVSEYRALRASVLRLWSSEQIASRIPAPTAEHYQQQIRFNEAVDEALADSIKTYSHAVEQMFEAKARRRMEALGTLAAGLGHDMGNVLMPMQMCPKLLTHEAATPATIPLIDALHRAVAHLNGLTKGLRAFSLDPEETAAAPECTVLHDWWVSAFSPFTWALPKGVRLHVDGLGAASPPLPPVRVPSHVLMQAIYNLVQNSAQALGQRSGLNAADQETSPAGNIWIAAALLPPTHGDAGSPAGTVRLTVRDDGPGMDARTVQRCTDAFFSTKAKNVGMGLGLHLVRTVLERHGGKLLVESQVGKGTMFTVLLPVAAAQSPIAAPHAAHAFAR